MSLSIALFAFQLRILGIIEGYVAEKAALEEALNLKEESERRLIVELENMRERFQELTQEQAILGEEWVFHISSQGKLPCVPVTYQTLV